MPTYKITDPNTGKKYKMTGDRAPTQEEVRHYVDDFESKKTASPPEEQNMEVGDVLTGAGLPSKLEEVQPFAENTLKTAAMPQVMLPKMLDSLLAEGKDRTSRYWNTLADDPTVGRAAQLMMAPIPGLGNIMENADKGIAEQDPHAQGRLIGNALTLAAPKAIEHAPEIIDAGKFAINHPVGRGVVGAGLGYGFGGVKGAVEGGALGLMGGNPLGRAGRVGKALFGDSSIPALETPMDATKSIKVEPPPVDPRLAQVKELELQNRLARAKGELPPNRESSINAGDVEELKKLRLQRQLEAERGKLAEGDISLEANPDEEVTPLPTPKNPPLESVSEFPTRYKNVKLKNVAPVTPSIPPPNPYSEGSPDLS